MNLEQQFRFVKPGDAGIIGNPIEHSLSPKMQIPALKAWWTESGRPQDSAPTYHRFLVEVDELEKALELVLNRHLIGVNVTIPFKRAVVPRLNSVDSFAATVSSVNTIKREGGQLLGFNTDGDGFEMALKNDLGFSPSGKSVLVLGLGGTGIVLINQLLNMDIGKIFYWNRNLNKTLGAEKSDSRLALLSEKEVAETSAQVDLIVNATSVGMKEKDGLPVPKMHFREGQFVYDVIYNRETALIKQAREVGLIRQKRLRRP
jgi:shikimate dehydrogenase